jgi:hypothetical protein
MHDWNKRLKISLWFGALPAASIFLVIEGHPGGLAGWIISIASLTVTIALVMWAFLRFLWKPDVAASYQAKMESRYRNRQLRRGHK